MASPKIQRLWWLGPFLMLMMLAYFGFLMFGPEKQSYLPGKTSDGHHQIETECKLCHTPFGGVKQEACLKCHGKELKAESDSHAPSIFKDPRSFYMLEAIDATVCITCHREHIAEQYGGGIAAIPGDFCLPCHKDIGTERPSHKGLSFDGCAASGCHNYHDNQSIYEDFLAKHLVEEDLLPGPSALTRKIAEIVSKPSKDSSKILSMDDQDSIKSNVDPIILAEWLNSDHSRNGVNCSDCHTKDAKGGSVQKTWTDYPDSSACFECHENQKNGFYNGKHGMRPASGLSPMRPGMARIPMKKNAHDKNLTCNTCHEAHAYNTRKAAVDSCLKCHDDVHSKAYKGSSHHRVWQDEVSGIGLAGTGVSCATCHMPRHIVTKLGETLVEANHNQSFNLRPNSKMIRTVCMNCHGLQYILNALADPDLVLNNYSNSPQRIVQSIDMVKRRQNRRIVPITE